MLLQLGASWFEAVAKELSSGAYGPHAADTFFQPRHDNASAAADERQWAARAVLVDMEPKVRRQHIGLKDPHDHVGCTQQHHSKSALPGPYSGTQHIHRWAASKASQLSVQQPSIHYTTPVPCFMPCYPQVIYSAKQSALLSSSGWCYPPGSSASGQSGSGNNWALGHHKFGPAMAPAVLDLVRKQVGLWLLLVEKGSKGGLKRRLASAFQTRASCNYVFGCRVPGSAMPAWMFWSTDHV